MSLCVIVWLNLDLVVGKGSSLDRVTVLQELLNLFLISEANTLTDVTYHPHCNHSSTERGSKAPLQAPSFYPPSHPPSYPAKINRQRSPQPAPHHQLLDPVSSWLTMLAPDELPRSSSPLLLPSFPYLA